MGESRTRTTNTVLSQPETVSFTRNDYVQSESLDDVNGGSSTYEKTSVSATEYRSITDIVTPDYKRRSAAGEIINNPMSSVLEQEWPPVAVPFSRHILNNDGTNPTRFTGSTYTGSSMMLSSDLLDYFGQPTEVADSIESLKAQAVTQAHAGTSASEISALMVAAESQKTIGSMASIMYDVYRIVKAARKLDFAYIRKQLSYDELENRYMELRYALRPLMYDAAGITNANNALSIYQRKRQTSRGFQAYSFSDKDTIEVVDGSRTYTVERSVKVDANIRAGVLSQVEVSALNVWGLDQPLETLWEVIPFSFIIDWFINIGDTIAAWTPNYGVKELASWVTVEKTVTYLNKVVSSKNTAAWSYSDSYDITGQKSLIRITKDRTVNPSLSYYPRSKVRLDALKLLDLTAISRGLLGRRVR